jgi:hypothetical protein
MESKPFRRWNQNNIIEAIEQFKISNGRYSAIKDFKHNRNIPTHMSVNKFFG